MILQTEQLRELRQLSLENNIIREKDLMMMEAEDVVETLKHYYKFYILDTDDYTEDQELILIPIDKINDFKKQVQKIGIII